MTERRSVLLVDDEPVIATILAESIGDAGYQVKMVLGGADALTVINESENLEILLTDINMPDVNGEQVAKAFRTKFPAGMIVVISGHIDAQANHERMEKVLKTHFLIKPFSTAELLKMMATFPGEYLK